MIQPEKKQFKRLYKWFKRLKPLKKVLLSITVLALFIYSSAVFAYNVTRSNAANSGVSKTMPTDTKHTAVAPINAQELIKLFNGQRVHNGLAALQENSQLDQAASARAKDMIAKNYQDSSSHEPWSFITAAGYKYSAASLHYAVGYNSAQEVINGWVKGSKSSTVFSVKSVSDVGIAIVNENASNGVQLVVLYQASPLGEESAQTKPEYDPSKEAQFNVDMMNYKTCQNASNTYYQYLTDEQNAANIDETAQKQSIDADNSLTDKEKDIRITAVQKNYNDRVNNAYVYYQNQMKNFGCNPIKSQIFNFTLPYTFYEDFNNNYHG